LIISVPFPNCLKQILSSSWIKFPPQHHRTKFKILGCTGITTSYLLLKLLKKIKIKNKKNEKEDNATVQYTLLSQNKRSKIKILKKNVSDVSSFKALT